MKPFVAVMVLLNASLAFGWGERGHHVICEVASRLVKEPALAQFLKSKGHQLGHVCNLPDVQWKSLGSVAKPGDAAHFMDPENLGYEVSKVPTDFKSIVAQSGKKPAEVAELLGSLWWRVDQFVRRAGDAARLAKASKSPKGSKEEQDDALPYNQGVFGMLVNFGLMGHFVGDASMPYHNTADYDGYGHQRGGIHAYYESASVNAMDLKLEADVFTDALRQRSKKLFPPETGTVTERMRDLSALSYGELGLVEAADQIYAPSSTTPNKVAAKRPDEEKGAKAFRAIIVPQMARSALLLAALWDESYRAGGAPVLTAYRSYRYPLFTEFVPLDYTAE